MRGCFPHTLVIVDRTTRCSGDKPLSPANQDWQFELKASIRATERIFLNFGDFRGTRALELPKLEAKGAFILKKSTKLCNCTT